ncbi:Methyltransferase-like protein 1, partial [Cucurbita argyrosperma subsp. argyrosperma]
MDSPESNRNYVKRDVEDGLGVKNDRVGDDEGWDGSDRRKHRSSRSRKSSNGEDVDGLDGSGRKKTYGDRSDSRKRSGGSSRGDSEEDEYDSRKESRSKQTKKKQEESTLEKLSSWYQDGELDNRKDVGDKLGSRGLGKGDENEKRKMTSKFSEHESSQSKSKNKEEKFHDGDSEKTLDRDSKYSEKRHSSREKAHGSSEQARRSRRRWDEPDAVKKIEESYSEKVESRSGKTSDLKYESPREKSMPKTEASEGKGQGLDSFNDKSTKSNYREDKKLDVERGKSRGRTEVQEEGSRASSVSREDKSSREKSEKYRQQKISTSRDVANGREKALNGDADVQSWTRDKGAREVGNVDKSKSPERTERHQESDYIDVDYERGSNHKRKELEKDGYRDDRSKGRDDSWSDRNRDREGNVDNWKRRQHGNQDNDTKSGDYMYDHGREWELPRHGRERIESERPHGRSSNRKDGSRGEAVKTSSNFGILNENYDVIEIQTKPLDYGRVESGNFARRTEAGQQSEGKFASSDGEWMHQQEGRARRTDNYGHGQSDGDLKERYADEGGTAQDQNSWRDDFDFHGGKGRGQKGVNSGRVGGGQSSSSGSQQLYGNQEPGSFNRVTQQGMKGNRVGRGGRGRPAGRESQQGGIPLPMIGSPFGPLGIPPPGPMQPLTPGMSPGPGPPVSPGVFIPPFSPPVWPGARGIDMSMLAVPPGPSGPRFPPTIGTPPNAAMYFNQSGSGRGVSSGVAGPGFNNSGPMGRGAQPDKNPSGWAAQKSIGPPGKAPSRGEQNDYSQNFVDTGMRPQNFIRELELTNVVEDYPKLRELIQKKDEIVANSASPPMYYKCDLRDFELSPEFFGTKFDVILIDPPWEEYVHRAPGVADHMEYWTFEEIMNLKIEAIADTPSFIFLWVGDGVGLEQGRQCLKKWGFRRCEDICWVKTNKNNAAPGLRHDSHTLFQHSKEHCLMGIKGTVRRSTDGHIIHANIDTDVIIAEEPPYGSTQKPEDMYRIIEHFALGRRRLELFGEDHNIRAGWLTVGKELSSSNFLSEAYIKNFADKDGKVWQGGGGRNPPPEASHLVMTTPEIELLRPKSPMKNQQQMQQQQSASLTTATSMNRRPTGNSPQNPTSLDVSNSNPMTLPPPWGSQMEGGFKGREANNIPLGDEVYDAYGFSEQPSGEYVDFESHRQINIL